MSEERDRNPHKLEVGKSYWARYWPTDRVGFKTPWQKVTITRFTSDGTPWAEHHDRNGSGILSGDCYEIMEITKEKELIEDAKIWLRANGLSAFALHSDVPVFMAQFFEAHAPKYLTDELLTRETNK